MKDSSGCLVYIVFAVAAGVCVLFFYGTKTISEAVLPASQVSVNGDPVQRIQPKGYNSQDDRNWMEGDKALDEGYANRIVAEAQATSIIANSPVGINPNNDGSFGSGMIIGAIVVVFLVGFLILNVGKR